MNRRAFLKTVAAGGCVLPLACVSGDNKVESVNVDGYTRVYGGKGGKKWKSKLTNSYIIGNLF